MNFQKMGGKWPPPAPPAPPPWFYWFTSGWSPILDVQICRSTHFIHSWYEHILCFNIVVWILCDAFFYWFTSTYFLSQVENTKFQHSSEQLTSIVFPIDYKTTTLLHIPYYTLVYHYHTIFFKKGLACSLLSRWSPGWICFSKELSEPKRTSM